MLIHCLGTRSCGHFPSSAQASRITEFHERWIPLAACTPAPVKEKIMQLHDLLQLVHLLSDVLLFSRTCGWCLAAGHASWKSCSLTSSPSGRSTSNSSRSRASSWDSMSSEATTCLKLNTNRCHEVEQRCDQQKGHRPLRETESCQQEAVLTSGEEGRSPSNVVNVTSGQAMSHLAVLQHQLELKIEAKLKFSQFLDEVSSRVLRPTNLFVLSRQTESSRSNSSISSNSNSKSRIPDVQQQPGDVDFSLHSIQSVDGMQEEQGAPETVGKAYLETDIDCVRREDEIKEVKTKKETAITFESNERREVKSPSESHPNPIQRIRPLSPLLYREEPSLDTPTDPFPFPGTST